MATEQTIGRITVKYIDGGDTISGSRSVINDNNTLLANAINTIEQYLNTETLSIQDIESVTVTKGTGSITDVLINTNGSIKAGGNILLNGTLEADYAELDSGLILNGGNLVLDSSDSILNLAGDFQIGGEIVLKDFANSHINAADKDTFTTNNWANLVYDGSGTTIVGGLISPKGMNAIIIDWSQWVSGDSRFYLDKLKLDTENILTGQTLKIMVLMGTITNHTFTIIETNLKADITMTSGIEFTANYQCAELIFDGTNWIVTNLRGCTLQ